jgi:hypothetical protein
MRPSTGALLLALLASPGLGGAELVIDACGTVVPSGETAALAGDLECAGAPIGVVLGYGTTLALDGFSIRGTSERAIDCVSGACRVVGGPGSLIEDCAGDGVALVTSQRLIRRGLVLSDLRIQGCGGSGVLAPLAGVVATRLEVSGNGQHGVDAWAVRATDLVASGNQRHGVRVARKLIATGITADGNAINGVNALEGRVRIQGATIRSNVHAGIAARRLRLEVGTVTDNNEGAFGIDLFIGRRPSLTSTTCGVSRQLLLLDGQILLGPTWGVCADD